MQGNQGFCVQLSIQVCFLCNLIFVLAITVSAQYCGRQAACAPCPTGECCSLHGVCGQGPYQTTDPNNPAALVTYDFCGRGCQTCSGHCDHSAGNALVINASAQNCGRQAACAPCPTGECCSVHGVCGQGPYQFRPRYNPVSRITYNFCGRGCQTCSGHCYHSAGDKEIRVFESGAIMIYLAEKYKSPLYPTDPEKRAEALGWLFWQVGGLGPMLGQTGHFWNNPKEDVPYAKERYRTESRRLMEVLDKALEGKEYLAGEYSIADIACVPWVKALSRYKKEVLDIDDYPNAKAWVDRIFARPQVQKGVKVNARQ